MGKIAQVTHSILLISALRDHLPMQEIRQSTPRLGALGSQIDSLIVSDNIDDQLAALEQFYCDFGFFIGWRDGSALQDGRVVNQLALDHSA